MEGVERADFEKRLKHDVETMLGFDTASMKFTDRLATALTAVRCFRLRIAKCDEHFRWHMFETIGERTGFTREQVAGMFSHIHGKGSDD